MLPPQIGDLAGLERLLLGNNRLTAIPKTIVKLEKLSKSQPSRRLRSTPTGLDLSHNLLTIHPTEINQLREEWGIELSGNLPMS